MSRESNAARAFAEKWNGRGAEKQESQLFWLELMEKVLGAEHATDMVRFEEKVKLSNTSFIDIMLPATHTMIEQKSITKELSEPIKQSDGTRLTPFQQAKRYSAELPYSERPRWIIVCNFRQFDIYDMERPNDPPTRVELANLENDWTCLRFITDVTSTRVQKEMELSRAAGQLVGRIYDALLPCYGEHPGAQDYQDLNKLIVRLVFCFYAEDAGLFGRHDQFHDYMESFAPKHFREGLMQLFRVLDQKEAERDRFMDDDLKAFPYVNGSLFTEAVPVPPMDDATRRLILDEGCGFDWSKISPTIFGAIFESTLNPETRRQGGMHYTSIENIHKVIDPLFLDDYRAAYAAAMQEKELAARRQKLRHLQIALGRGKYFDPACGSGNFLTESYLSLRRLENDILRELIRTQKDRKGGGNIALDFAFEDASENAVQVSIDQFYGIEVNDFAVAVAKTAMWIAESQMFEETQEFLSSEAAFLPLTANSNIHEGNALRMDWRDVVAPDDDVKIMGNPPFVGSKKRSAEQRADVKSVLGEWDNAGNLDYVACWYRKATDYIEDTSITAAFVSTNSITQGEQVAALWKPLRKSGVHINFAYRTFRWDSEAEAKAQVHCVIIGFSKKNVPVKTIYSGNLANQATNINGYLLDAADAFLERRREPISDVPKIVMGPMSISGNHLILTEEERADILKSEPQAEKWIRRFSMGKEFIQGEKRYCLWLEGITPKELRTLPKVFQHVKDCKEYREQSKPTGDAYKFRDTPHLFRPSANFHTGEPYLALPQTSSENRRYIPMDFITNNMIPGQKLYIIPNADRYMFGILTSNVHMAWMRVVAGRMKSDYSYSVFIVYNNFPWPTPTPAQRAAIERTAQGILDARALYPDSSLADLYDEVLMPKELREAHRKNDRAVMEAYGFWGTIHDEPACVAALMKMYEALTSPS